MVCGRVAGHSQLADIINAPSVFDCGDTNNDDNVAFYFLFLLLRLLCFPRLVDPSRSGLFRRMFRWFRSLCLISLLQGAAAEP